MSETGLPVSGHFDALIMPGDEKHKCLRINAKAR